MSTLSIITRGGTAKSLATDIIDEFGNHFHGELITPADIQYESSRKTWNGMIDKKPALIARCADASDVKSAVNFSRENDLLFSIRGGGHNVAGSSIADGGLVIDLSKMRSVTVDSEKRLAYAEGGVRLGDLDHETQKFNLAVQWAWSRRPVWQALPCTAEPDGCYESTG